MITIIVMFDTIRQWQIVGSRANGVRNKHTMFFCYNEGKKGCGEMIIHKGEVLFRQGDDDDHLYRIQTGLFKVTRLHPNGKEVLFNVLYPGEIVPHHSLITAKEKHGTATAMVHSEVEVIKGEAWYRQLRENREKPLEVALLLQDKLRFMQQRMDHLTAGSPAERLKLLNQWLEEHSQGAPLAEMLTQEEIGQLIGLRRETVNRLLRGHSEE